MAMNTIPRASADRLKRESEFSEVSDSPEAPEESDTPDTSDGRRLRRSRNRDAVVDALLALYRDGNLDPSAADVAERSGLSPRSLFRYFDDVDDLCRAAIDRQYAMLATVAEIVPDPGAPLESRVQVLVDTRINLYETAGKVGLVARLRAPFEPLIADQLFEGRAALRAQIEALFQGELATLGASHRSTAVSAIDALCTFETYHLMRDNQGLTSVGISSVLRDSLLTLLGHPPA
jgi:AcrR family transcriptional regulator